MKKTQSLKNEIIVFILFALSRLPILGYEAFNTDVWKWKARTYNFSSGIFYLDFAETLQKYHPGVVLMWLGTAGIKLNNLYYEYVFKTLPPDNNIDAIFRLHSFQKLLVVLLTSFTIAVIFYALKRSISKKYAIIAIVLISIEPFFIGLNRVFHLEGLMSSFMIASFVWLFYYITDIKNKNALYVSAIFGSLAVLTKTSALFSVLFAALLLLLHYYSEKKKIVPAIKIAFPHYLKWFLAFFVVFVLLWPAIWVSPINVFETLYRGIFTIGVEQGHPQLFLGSHVLDPGPLFYLVAFLLRTSPFMIVGIVGYFIFARKSFNSQIRKFILYAILFSILYVLMLSLSSKKLDRYLLPSILSLCLVSAFFYEWFVEKFKDVGKIIFASVIAIWIIFLVVIHPDYFSYYSFFGGGLSKGIYVIEPKWMIGQKEIVEFMEDARKEEDLQKFEEGESLKNSKNLENKLTVAFPEKYYTQIWPFIQKAGGWAVINGLTPEAKQTHFFVYPVWEDDSIKEDRFKIRYYGVVKIREVPVYNVYQRVD